MSKFKVGDRVVFTHTDYEGEEWAIGSFGIVKEVKERGCAIIACLPSEDGPLFFLNYELEKTSDEKEPFITTIPPQPAKRVLKDYVLVTNNVGANIHMSVTDYENEGVGFNINHQYMEASDIAELITFLTKVHEVLKENENDA